MTQYLDLVNRLGENLRYDPIATTDFDDPRDPFPQLKRYLNEAKDTVIARIGSGLFERELLLETKRAATYANVGNSTLATGGIFAGGIVSSVAFLDATWVGAKVSMPDVAYDQTTVLPAGTGPKDPTWRRITSIVGSTIAFIDSEFSASANTSSQWTVFKDEYDLDPSVRRVLSAWMNDGPLDLVFVDAVADLDRLFPGLVTFGTPQVMAIVRSETSGNIWTARLYPAPLERTLIRYRAKTRLADLALVTDTWPIEPELEAIIVDEATRKACASPLRNDPDLAMLYNQDVSRRSAEWKAENDPNDPHRRLRRRGPSEGTALGNGRIARVTFTTT